MTNPKNPKLSFEALTSRIGGELGEMWDVYVSSDHKGLLHYPITFLKFQEVLTHRERLAKSNTHELVAVEVVYEEALNDNPENPRRTGCFRRTEWLTPDFESTPKPAAIKEMQKHLEKKSRWLSGGPRPLRKS